MNKNPLLLKIGRALLFALLCATTGSAFATPNFGTRLDNWCALRPIQSTPPQQSRPYTASGSSCAICHNTSSPSTNDLNARGNAASTCTGTGAATTCGAAVNAYCIATAPTASSIAIASPPAGTIVTQGQSVTFTAGGTSTSPDGFLLSYTWLFSNGLPNADGFSVTVPMSTVGSVTATLQVRNQVGMLAIGTSPTRTITVTPLANQPPVATIVAPAGNVTVTQGGTVTFQGSGTDPDNNLPLTYSWNFGGGAPNSTVQNPGAVMFNTVGTFTVSFTVIDSLGLPSTAVTRTVIVTPPANQPPVATIVAPSGNVTVTQGGTVTFQGSGTDPNNNLPLTYSWNFGGGAPNSTAQNPGAVMFNTVGTFTVSFTVTDSLGLPSTAVTRTVIVTSPANQPPVATIVAPSGNVTIAQGGTVTFQGSGTDPNNNLPLTYSWNFGGGAPNSTAQNPGAVMFNTAGTFTVSFTVIDSLGLPSTAVTRTVIVTPPANQPPVATIVAPSGNVTVTQGGTVTFQGSGTDPNNNLPLTYSWNFGGGAPNSTAQNPGAVMFNTVGTFTVSFTVTDSLGLPSTAVTRTVIVTSPANQPPVATIVAPTGNVTIAQGGTVTFQGSGTDPNNNLPLTYSWNFGGGAPNSTAQNPGTVAFNTAGTFTVSFTVTDSLGLASTAVTRTVTVTAANQGLVATIVAPAINVSVLPGGTVTFKGSTSGGSTPLRFLWNFQGGTPSSSTLQNPGVVRFNNVGTFTVTLTVTDNSGATSTPATRAVTVARSNQFPRLGDDCNEAPPPANQPPVATITAPTGNVTVTQGGTVTFQGSGTDPDNNLPLTYSWNFGGGAPNSTQQNPGAVRFNTVGTFTVSFTVIDSLGLASTPVTRTITVTPPANQPPVATITSPTSNVTISRGRTVTFRGFGTDPDNNLPLTYRWNFGGGAPNSTLQNPGAVRFNTAGTFTVTFTVTDSRGLASAPATRTIRVRAGDDGEHDD